MHFHLFPSARVARCNNLRHQNSTSGEKRWEEDLSLWRWDSARSINHMFRVHLFVGMCQQRERERERNHNFRYFHKVRGGVIQRRRFCQVIIVDSCRSLTICLHSSFVGLKSGYRCKMSRFNSWDMFMQIGKRSVVGGRGGPSKWHFQMMVS